jgi:tetratricopeptide (TPR) repeat protein
MDLTTLLRRSPGWRTLARQRYGLIVVAITSAALAACGAQSTPAQRASNLVTQGLKAQLSGDSATAESDYTQAIQLDANNKYAHYDIGTIYDRQGKKPQAIQEYQTTLRIDPNFTDAMFNLAVDTATGDPAGAEQLYRQVITLQPSWAGAWLNLGFVLMGEGKTDEARADWAKAISLDPTMAPRIPSGSSPSAVPAATPTPA